MGRRSSRALIAGRTRPGRSRLRFVFEMRARARRVARTVGMLSPRRSFRVPACPCPCNRHAVGDGRCRSALVGSYGPWVGKVAGRRSQAVRARADRAWILATTGYTGHNYIRNNYMRPGRSRRGGQRHRSVWQMHLYPAIALAITTYMGRNYMGRSYIVGQARVHYSDTADFFLKRSKLPWRGLERNAAASRRLFSFPKCTSRQSGIACSRRRRQAQKMKIKSRRRITSTEI